MVKAGGFIAELIVQLLARLLVTATIMIIKKLNPPRRALVTRCGRRIQNLFHFPRFACTFAETDTRVTDGDTRIGAWFATVAPYIFNPGLLLVFVKRNLLDPLVTMWLGLVQSRRRRLSRGGSGGYITTGTWYDRR